MKSYKLKPGKKHELPDKSRRRFVIGASAMMSLAAIPFAKGALAKAISEPLPQLSGKVFNLSIDYKVVNYTGKKALATVVNQQLPAPVLRWKEGETVTLRVKNNLDQVSSIHWHGIILPTEMDGVPGLSFDGIMPGETFEYQFTLNQSGTYWYHSHSSFQEQTGVYGPIIIDPAEPDPVQYDRDYVVMLSDWSDTPPEKIYANLKKHSTYYNYSERTLGDVFADINKDGLVQTWKNRAMWNNMRMSDRDISDVTGTAYTYLINGKTLEQGWQALFKAGEKIRLRLINAAAMTIFDFRIPGLKMTVVACDGQNIQPVTVDEFRIATAETYDIIVEPENEGAYCLYAQNIDRTGFVAGTLTSDPSHVALIPAMDEAPILGHADMGMDHSGMDHGDMHHGDMDHSDMQHGAMDHAAMGHGEMDHAVMDHQPTHANEHGTAETTALGLAGFGSTAAIHHAKTEFGPQVDMHAETPQNGLHDPGIGLREHQTLHNRKVLNYGDIKGLHPTRDTRQPSREIQLHLTGNMHRYMWSINGIKFTDAEPLKLEYGERVRITLVNDTMMTHPMHLHGLWSELETGDPDFIPRKHTVIVQPGSKISYLVTADAKGRWAYHCHLLYHMPGMFIEVLVE